MISNICKEKNIHFVPMPKFLLKEDLDDGLHPNSQGHEKISRTVETFLTENKIL